MERNLLQGLEFTANSSPGKTGKAGVLKAIVTWTPALLRDPTAD